MSHKIYYVIKSQLLFFTLFRPFFYATAIYAFTGKYKF
jgi:hypothetical protein